LQLPTRPFLAASPATPRTSSKRPRRSSATSSSPSPYDSSSSPRQSTPSSSPPQLNQCVILETKDRSKRLRLDDTIIVGTHEKTTDGEERAEDSTNADEGAGDDESLLDYILSRLEPIPKLQTISELLQEAMDSISDNSRSQEARVKYLEDDFKKSTEGNKLKLSSLHQETTSHEEQIKSLNEVRTTQAELISKLEKAVARVETKLATIEEKVTKEISDWRLDRQSQSLAAQAGNPASYDKLKARCRKLEGQFHSLQQSSSIEERKHRLLEGNTKYTRQLNDSVNVWKTQCDKEHTNAKLLKEQMQALEKRSSAMEEMLRDQQKLIVELTSQLGRQRDTSRVSETPLKEFWQR